MSDILRQIFMESFVRGVGKTSGTLITMFVGWQIAKVTYGHDDFLSFLMGRKSQEKSTILSSTDDLDNELDHEEINLEDMEEHKYKSLFDKLNR
jgi:hypothetical protein